MKAHEKEMKDEKEAERQVCVALYARLCVGKGGRGLMKASAEEDTGFKG